MLEIKEVSDIQIIKPLWEVLNRDLQGHSKYFSKDYSQMTFEDYIQDLNKRSACRLEVVFLDDKPLGFCLGSVYKEVGTVNELYLYDDLRGKGMGKYLFDRMVLWLETQDLKSIEIRVPAGYESVIQFYQRSGFQTASFLMKRKA